MDASTALKVDRALQKPIFKLLETYDDVCYVVVPVDKLKEVDFNELLIDSEKTARRSIDGKLCILSFRIKPDRIREKPVGLIDAITLAHDQITKVVQGSNWATEEEEWQI